jgi:hypothetical protein
MSLKAVFLTCVPDVPPTRNSSASLCQGLKLAGYIYISSQLDAQHHHLISQGKLKLPSYHDHLSPSSDRTQLSNALYDGSRYAGSRSWVHTRFWFCWFYHRKGHIPFQFWVPRTREVGLVGLTVIIWSPVVTYSLIHARPCLHDSQSTPVPPDELESHAREYVFRTPCCPCAYLTGSFYTLTKISLLEAVNENRTDAIRRPFIGEYVAECATNTCGYFGVSYHTKSGLESTDANNGCLSPQWSSSVSMGMRLFPTEPTQSAVSGNENTKIIQLTHTLPRPACIVYSDTKPLGNHGDGPR